jgi:hypothetical protein
MATVEYMHFCEHAFFDSRRQPCIIGILDFAIYAHAFPLRLASITIATGIRIKAGERAELRLELGRKNTKPDRWWPLTLPGPKTDGDIEETVAFIPFKTVSLAFLEPMTLVARFLEKGTLIGEKSLQIRGGERASENPIGPPAPDPDLR